MTTSTGHLYIVTDDRILSSEPKGITGHLPHLTLAQIFDALSYYTDHTGDINAHIKRNR